MTSPPPSILLGAFFIRFINEAFLLIEFFPLLKHKPTDLFGTVKSSWDALEVQRVAEIEVNTLSLLSYDNLDINVNQDKWSKSDANDGWEYKVNIGSEKVINPSTNSKQRITTVSVLKEGDVIEKFQTKVPFFCF